MFHKKGFGHTTEYQDDRHLERRDKEETEGKMNLSRDRHNDPFGESDVNVNGDREYANDSIYDRDDDPMR